ncbi:ABC transporter permease [Candidatus Neomarinimicrobiota bacterium]
MIKNYITVAFRNIIKNKVYSFLNITGLAVGVMAFIMIMLYVRFEFSFDKNSSNSKNIYRVNTRGSLNGDFEMAVSPAPVGAAFVDEIPGVINFTRVRNFGFPVIRYEEKVFSEERWFTTDSSFFEVFDIGLIQGNYKTALIEPNSVVVTQSTAKRYFGTEDPIGKIFNSDRQRDYIVTGVVEDPPDNTHFHYDFLASMMTYPDAANNGMWVSNNFYTYLLLDENTLPKQVESEFPGMVLKYAGPQIEQFLGVSWDKLVEQGASYGFYLQPLTDIHLFSTQDGEVEPNGSILYVRIFSIVALFILVIACINFMNLATARSTKRAREVGVRKTLGSSRLLLIQQFLTESLILSFISFVFAIILVKLLLPMFNNIGGFSLQLNLFSDPFVMPSIIVLMILVGVISGSYPAFYLASFNPVKVFKGSAVAKGQKSWLRSGLVIFQFTITIMLFTGTLIIYNQLNYIQNKELGYNKENVIIVEKTDDIGASINSFKEDLKQDPRILSVSNSTSLIGHDFNSNVRQLQGEPSENSLIYQEFFTDPSYAITYGLEMSSGRFFSSDRIADSTAAVINETAANILGFDDPIGKAIIDNFNDGETVLYPIIGVVKDFHLNSLHSPIEPMLIRSFRAGGFGRYTAVRIQSNDIPDILGFIEQVWKKYAIDQPFEYTFLDDDFDQLYIAEKRTQKIVTIFAILAMFIASLGLFGLSSYIAEQRTKEVGIRKVLGASVKNIYILLSKDILKLMVIATVISWPLTVFTMNKWLQNFAYRIEFNHLFFLLSGLIAFIIAQITVTNQALKAANRNPVTALKYE